MEGGAVNENLRPRLDSVDILRGLVIVLMALDHVRDFFTDVRFDPLDLEQTTVALFLTRWITHFCAPAFVFLAGASAFLYQSRGKSTGDLSHFLLTRGVWLVIIELTVVRFGWVFNLDYHFMIGQVIWAIGWSMIALSALVWLRTGVVTVIGLVIVFGHNLLDPLVAADFGSWGWLWQILHEGGMIRFGDGYIFGAFYPLLPWVGVIAIGYGFGALLLNTDAPRRRRNLIVLGTAIIVLFVILRYFNVYGDAHHWSSQSSALFTVFSFVDTVKYPPSLLFLLMTLGPSIIALALFDYAKGPVAQFFIVFGRVPFFFYVLHIPLIHLLALFTAMATVDDYSFMWSNLPPWMWPEGYGFGLPVVYAVWVFVIALLYWPCKWFAGVKQRHPHAALSYL